MDRKAITIKELLEQKASEEPEDSFEQVTVPAGQEWPHQQVTQVIRKTIVVHEGRTQKKRIITEAHFLLDGDYLYREHDKKHARKLPNTLRDALLVLIAANHEYVQTKLLLKKAGYVAFNTFKSHVQRLKAWGRDVHDLHSNIIDGATGGGGYHIPPEIAVQRVPSGRRSAARE